MGRATAPKLIVALVAFGTATPALASDFSGIFYIFAGFAIAVGALTLLIVAFIHRLNANGGPKVDAVSAVLLGAAIAPVGAVDGNFSFFPAWIFFLLDGFSWDELVSPLVSFAVTSGVLFYIFREFRLNRAAKQQEADR